MKKHDYSEHKCDFCEQDMGLEKYCALSLIVDGVRVLYKGHNACVSKKLEDIRAEELASTNKTEEI